MQFVNKCTLLGAMIMLIQSSCDVLQAVSCSADDVDNDVTGWGSHSDVSGDDSVLDMMRGKHLSSEELKELVDKFDVSHVARSKRQTNKDEERAKRLPRLGVRSPFPRLGLVEELEEEKEKRLPRMGIRSPLPRIGRSPLPRLGLREVEEERRDKRLPRMGKRELLDRYSAEEKNRDKRLPRMGRAAPFPRLGRASPFPRLGRASPFPRLGRSLEGDSSFTAYDSWLNDDQDETYYDSVQEPFESSVETRASPFPRLG